MTAINLICEDKRVFVMSDSALLSSDGGGKVSRFKTKISAYPQLHMACGTSGKALHDLTMDVVLAGFANFDDVVTGIVESLLDAWSGGQFIRPTGESEPFRFFMAGWSARNRRCEGYAISSMAEAGHDPFELLRRELMFTPGISREQVAASGVEDPSISPEVSLLALIEGQRNTLLGPHYTIGGSACLTTIDEAGITQRIVRRWPDELGELLAPAPHVECRAEPMSKLKRDMLERKARKRLRAVS